MTSNEDDLTGRRPNRKTTLQEDDLKGRQLQWKTTAMKDNHNGRRPQWKTTSMEGNTMESYRKQMTSASLASRSFTELGPAQPSDQIAFPDQIPFVQDDDISELHLVHQQLFQPRQSCRWSSCCSGSCKFLLSQSE